jgi:hypothetical protein
MARFVNYQKRGVELPRGCKDLMDVLKRTSSGTKDKVFGDKLEAMPKPDLFPSGGIRHIERYVMRLRASSARFVLIASLDGQAVIQLNRDSGQAAHDVALVVQPRDQGQARAIKRFCEERGTARPLEGHESGVRAEEMRALEYPLPSDARLAAGLLADLLQRVFALNADAGLAFA